MELASSATGCKLCIQAKPKRHLTGTLGTANKRDAASGDDPKCKTLQVSQGGQVGYHAGAQLQGMGSSQPAAAMHGC